MAGIGISGGKMRLYILWHIQVFIPIIVFFVGFLAYFGILGLVRVILLLVLSIAGYPISIAFLKRGGPYGVDLDTPYPEDRPIVERKSVAVYTLASVLAIADSLILSDSFAIILACIAVLPNYLFIGYSYRIASGMLKYSQEEYKRKDARRPSRVLFEDDARTMYEMRDAQALLGVVENADDARLRGLAAELLGRLGDSSVSDDLTIGLSDDDDDVCLKTAIALCHLGKDLAYYIFDERWDELDVDTKFEIIYALLDLNSVDARIFLERTYKDDNPDVSARALEALIEARGKAERISRLESKTIPPEERD
jgi:hypothetical protein